MCRERGRIIGRIIKLGPKAKRTAIRVVRSFWCLMQGTVFSVLVTLPGWNHLAGITGTRESSILLRADTGDTLSLGNRRPRWPEADHSGDVWGGVVTTIAV